MRDLSIPERILQNHCNNKGIGTPRLARGDKLHHKFAVIDNKAVVTDYFNWSPSAAHTNDETQPIIHSPKLSKHSTPEMNQLWRDAELGITSHIQGILDRQRIQCGDIRPSEPRAFLVQPLTICPERTIYPTNEVTTFQKFMQFRTMNQRDIQAKAVSAKSQKQT